MPHVQLTAGVGKHCQTIELVFVRIFIDLEHALFFPVLAGALLDVLRFITGVHSLVLSVADTGFAKRITQGRSEIARARLVCPTERVLLSERMGYTGLAAAAL